MESHVGAESEIDPDVIPLSVADMEFVLAPEKAACKTIWTMQYWVTVNLSAYLAAVQNWMQERHDFAVR